MRTVSATCRCHRHQPHRRTWAPPSRSAERDIAPLGRDVLRSGTNGTVHRVPHGAVTVADAVPAEANGARTTSAAMTGQTPTKILLDESELPTQWYNVIPDLPAPPPPPLHPARSSRSAPTTSRRCSRWR